MDLTIIRHGQSHVNLGGWEKLESVDAGLSELGQKQATALRDWLHSQNKSADVLYASTMKRTRETAVFVSEALGLDPIFDDRIREVGNSYRDGNPIAEADLPRKYTGFKNPTPFVSVTDDVENPESWMHFRIRVGEFLHELIDKHLGQTVYVVAHGGVIAATFDTVFNVGSYKQCSIDTINTGWARFIYDPENSLYDWKLRDHNRVDHLVIAGLIEQSSSR